MRINTVFVLVILQHCEAGDLNGNMSCDGYYLFQNILLNPHKFFNLKAESHQIMCSAKDCLLLKPATAWNTSSERENGTERWDGITIFLRDDITNFMYHLFHFLEQLLPLLSMILAASKLSMVHKIVLTNAHYSEIFEKNKLNKEFLDLILPNITVIGMDTWGDTNRSRKIYVNVALISDRKLSMRSPLVRRWSKMMVSCCSHEYEILPCGERRNHRIMLRS